MQRWLRLIGSRWWVRINESWQGKLERFCLTMVDCVCHTYDIWHISRHYIQGTFSVFKTRLSVYKAHLSRLNGLFWVFFKGSNWRHMATGCSKSLLSKWGHAHEWGMLKIRTRHVTYRCIFTMRATGGLPYPRPDTVCYRVVFDW